jgi:hypothetical protein
VPNIAFHREWQSIVHKVLLNYTVHRRSLLPTSYRSMKCSGATTLTILSGINFSIVFVSLRFCLKFSTLSTVVKAQYRHSNVSLCLRLQMACFLVSYKAWRYVVRGRRLGAACAGNLGKKLKEYVWLQV